MVIGLKALLIGILSDSDVRGPVNYVCEGVMIDWCY
jgi:hypothetical protein